MFSRSRKCIFVLIFVFILAMSDTRLMLKSVFPSMSDQDLCTPLPRWTLCFPALLNWGLRAIAEEKMPDLNSGSVEAAMLVIAGTARCMGVEVEN